MPIVKNPGVRLRLIDECLQRRHKYWPAELLFKVVGEKFLQETGRTFSKSQFNLDIRALKTDYQAPLVNDKERGYHYTEPSFSIVKSPLVSEDAAVLRQALATLRQFQGLGLSDELGDVVQRVEAHLQAQPDDDVAGQPVIWFEQVPDYAGTPFLGPLYQAIRARQVLRLRYRPFDAAEAYEIVVQPYLLKQYNHRWFLIGVGTGRAGLSNFALDRIEGLEPAPDAVYYPPPAAIEARFADVVGVSVPADGSVAERVSLRFRAGRGRYVLTKPLHPSQRLEAENVEVIEVSLWVIPTQELETLLLSFGEDLEVLAPLELRTRISERLQAATGQYQR